jgi:hypothetical protein
VAGTEIDMRKEKWECITCDDGRLAVVTAGDVICVSEDNIRVGDEIAAKNFRRISALPDALAALQQALDAWPDWDDGGPVNGGDMVEWFGNWRETVKAALTKAEGSTNG